MTMTTLVTVSVKCMLTSGGQIAYVKAHTPTHTHTQMHNLKVYRPLATLH